MAKNTMGKLDRVLELMDEYDLRVVMRCLAEFLPQKDLLKLCNSSLKCRRYYDLEEIETGLSMFADEFVDEEVDEYLLIEFVKDLFRHPLEICQYYGDKDFAENYLFRAAQFIKYMNLKGIGKDVLNKISVELLNCASTGNYDYILKEEDEEE
ncbi:MAG: hypothetical protein MJZ21_01000 [archaeon]|nr:hypothetical protein [archaeon]